MAERGRGSPDCRQTCDGYHTVQVIPRVALKSSHARVAGMFPIAHTGSSTTRFRIPGYSALVVSSGTSTSTRGRGQPNTFNIIRTEHSQIAIERWQWLPNLAAFELLCDETFMRKPDGWSAAT